MEATENSISRYRSLENFHIILWLLKDLCWCTLSRSMGLIMILPTLILAIYITILYRNNKAELLHNSAIVFWICANSVWMIGEFFFEDGLREYALIFFILGLSSVAYYYVSEFLFKLKKKDVE